MPSRGRKFRGSQWQKVNGDEERQFLMNKYRVLLTRARRGMVIWVPRGSVRDETREVGLLDATAEYLGRAGIGEIGA
ncbi:MAG TPA: DNA/RNA helicase domain-containing protein [Phycisphaerae bacterium]|nr:DNA/RNA helicase domain-containing protein [Phycisphaerae bacterium]